MKTIKVIDLLNKIANGEEVPEEIEFRNHKFVFDGVRYYTNNGDEEFIDCLAKDGVTEYWLNSEVEIIEDAEEDKEIEKLNISYLSLDDSVLSQINTIHCNTVTMEEKLNEVIDAVNKLNKKGE